MPTGDRQRVSELFEAVVDLPAVERTQYLARHCPDTALRAEVEALLDHDRDDTFLATPVARPASLVDEESEDLPDRIGPYTIVRRIGRGGMGTVFEARQDHPQRIVALKVLRPEVTSSEALRRFEHEAQVLAALEHPGIAHVYATGVDRVGTDHGEIRRPFFAMEMVRGAPLDQYAREHDLSVARRLELMAAVCDAVQHAHQKGIIHRDLKPGNILVNDQGEPKVLDFGVARVTDADIRTVTLQTSVGQLLGTVPYMSPEQAAGRTLELDVRSDVYALGVIAHELLAGKLPYTLDGQAITEAVRSIQEVEPQRLGTIDTTLRGDVETIVRKALEKDADRRYPSAAALADDFRRYLDHQPIVARPPSLAYQTKLFARRHRIAVVAALLVTVALVAGTVISTVFAVRASREASRRAHQQLVAERISSHLEYLLMGPDPSRLGSDTTVAEMLRHVSARLDTMNELPEVEAEVRTTIATTYSYLHDYDSALVELERAVAPWRGIDAVHPRLAKTLADLGRAYGGQGHPADAVPLFIEALELLHHRPGGAYAELTATSAAHQVGVDADAGRIAGRLISYLSRLERYEEAERYARELVTVYRADPARDPVGLVLNLRRLSRIRDRFDDPDESLALLLEGVQHADALIDARHPVRGAITIDCGDRLREAGRFDEAQAMLERGVALVWDARTVGGSDWLVALDALLKLLVERGETDAALVVLDDAIVRLETAIGPDHRKVDDLRSRRQQIAVGPGTRSIQRP